MDMTKKTLKITKPKTSYADTLRISPFAFAKIRYWRDYGDVEVAAYATTGTDNPLLITDFRLIKQQSSIGDFDLDPNDLAKDVERTLDDGLCPWQTHNILVHSHPGNCPNPSGTDEHNFQKAFSHPDWAIMLIIAQDDSMYCRLKLNTGPGAEKLLKVQIDFSQEFQASDHTAWKTEYEKKVTKQQFFMIDEEGFSAQARIPTNKIQTAWEKYLEGSNDNQDMELDCDWDEDGAVSCFNDEDGTWYVYDPVTRQWYVEDLFGNDEHVSEIQAPNGPWTAKILAWAEKHADERKLAMERKDDYNRSGCRP